ncbi:chemotaxis protein CheB [Cellvibrio sp. ARAG 10.3]|uniref:chemotaxis protein CheB n=1 Tax=Cellvibrio sp. ARAG 10.3 TaxID=3451358 RepID=UPI003F448247
MCALRVGILVDSATKQHYLTGLVTQAGHQLACTLLLNTASSPPKTPLDAWIIDVTADQSAKTEQDETQLAHEQFVERLLETATVPVILSDSSEYSEGSEGHKAWLRRMTQRLQRLSGDINLQQTERAPRLWVLAASTGGPAAVKEFLSYLPAELGIAFVYVQHIDAHYSTTLIRMMSGAGHYPAALACQGAVLQPDAITLISAERRVDILENGTLLVSEKPWGGCYAPSIDQVVANVARIYRERSGLIVFTGMGDDGAASARLIKQQGGQVWVQTPTSCTSSSMPEATLATESVGFSGTPKELAQQLATFTRGSRGHQAIKLPNH